MIYLRAADRLDSRTLATLRAASLIEMELIDAASCATFVAQATREIAALFGAERLSAWLAWDDRRAIASACAVFHDRLPYPDGSRHAEVCGVYVEPGYRRRGYATELVREVLAAVRAGGARKTFLRPSAAGKALYGPLGFVASDLMTLDHRAATVHGISS